MAGHETEELIIAYRSKSESKIVYLVIMQMILVLCTISPFNSFIYLEKSKGVPTLLGSSDCIQREVISR